MKKIISLLLVLMLIITSSMTAFADNPTTIDELIEKFKIGVQTDDCYICPTDSEVDAFRSLISNFDLTPNRITVISSFLDSVNEEIIKASPKDADDMGFYLKFRIVRLSTRMVIDLLRNTEAIK